MEWEETFTNGKAETGECSEDGINLNAGLVPSLGLGEKPNLPSSMVQAWNENLQRRDEENFEKCFAHLPVPSYPFVLPDRYDFAVYGLLAPEIGGAFFPDASDKLQLINSFGVYLAAFLMR